MGFLSKAKLDKARATNKNDLKSILIPASGKPVRAPLTPIIDYIPGRRPQKPQTLQELLASRPGLNPRDKFARSDPLMDYKFKKRGGFGGSLREAIRRLKEQGGMGMPANPDGRVYAGGSPGLYAPGGRFNPGGRNRIMPNFGMEQMPIARRDPSALERIPMGEAPSFNPTIFGQPIPQGADFSNMPNFSQIDMSQLDLSGIPQSISQMNLPQMPEGLPSMEEIQGNRRMPQMDRGRMQPRMMMAEGDEVFMPSNPNQIAFSIETEIKNLMNEYEMAANNGEIERAQMVAEQINELEARRIQAMNEAKTMENLENENFEGSTLSDITIQEMLRNKNKMVYGGEMKGYANGGEIENMLSGMDSGEQEAMGELEQMAPEMEMIDQLVMMVAQMIQQGAGEEEVIGFLREQGLDDEDIGTVLQLVAEMSETEEMAEDQIGNELAQLG
jgi:D-ribose pyranose/furanose isomerase RbsD